MTGYTDSFELYVRLFNNIKWSIRYYLFLFILFEEKTVSNSLGCVLKEVNFVLDLANNSYLVRDNDSWKGVFYTSNFLCQFQLTVPSVFFSWFNGLQGFLKRERATTGTGYFEIVVSKLNGYRSWDSAYLTSCY